MIGGDRLRFIHTSDWHLGKNLEGHPRIDEQRKFCEDFVKTVKEKDADMVIIAGDIYDTANPPAEAERLFYKTVSEIASNGQRCVVVIAGNHDSPDRISAASNLAFEQGILIFGYPLSKTYTGKFDGFEIIDAKEGMTTIKIKDEEIKLLTLPYPSEKRLNDAFGATSDEERQMTYSQKVGDIFRNLQKEFREDTINIAVSHIFVAGGESSDSERQIQLGGSLLVERRDLPNRAQYTALGHLHKPQKGSELGCVYYSGSPLQYSKSERIYSKGAKLVELYPGEKAIVEDIMFKNYKPIEVFKCRGISDAIEVSEKNSGREIWSYFEIETDEVISQENIKILKGNLKDIIEIKPIMKEIEREIKYTDIRKKSMAELFRDFYRFSRNAEPSGELMSMFMEIAGEGGEE